MSPYSDDLHDGSLPDPRPDWLPAHPTPMQVAYGIADRLRIINWQRGRIGAVALELWHPQDLAGQIRNLAGTLEWSEEQGGKLTDERAFELGAYVVAFLIARARVDELDITSGDAA